MATSGRLVAAALTAAGVIAALAFASFWSPGGRAGDEDGPAWNDPGLLGALETEPRLRDLVPSVGDADRRYVVAAPPASEVKSCMGWVRRCVAGDLPADFASHLLALRRWPKRGGEDVFVVWYRTGGRLVHIVESNAEVVVTSVPMSQGVVPVDPGKHLDFVLAAGRTLLTKEMLPHPLCRPRVGSGTAGITTGSWRPAALDIIRDAQGRHAMRTPDTPTIELVRFQTDGKVVRFELVKILPGPVGSVGRLSSRFSQQPSSP